MTTEKRLELRDEQQDRPEPRWRFEPGQKVWIRVKGQVHEARITSDDHFASFDTRLGFLNLTIESERARVAPRTYEGSQEMLRQLRIVLHDLEEEIGRFQEIRDGLMLKEDL